MTTLGMYNELSQVYLSNRNTYPLNKRVEWCATFSGSKPKTPLIFKAAEKYGKYGGSVVVDFLFIVTLIVGVCNCYMFCCMLLCVLSSIAIILMGKRELVALLNLSSWCLVMVEQLFLAMPQGCLRFVIVVFPDHTHLLFWTY